MAQSLVKLTLESNQYERNLRNAQKQLNDFTRSIGINMKSLSGMALAAGAVTGALKVAKDAFFNNEQQLDEWGRTVEASKSIYNGFLNALNNGDISGYLSNINTIAEAARAAYDALDELSTFNAFNQVNVEKTRTGMTEAIAGYRMGESSKESVQAAVAAYKKELQQRQEKEQFAYLRAIRKIAAERGVPGGDLEKALSGSYGSYKELKETMPTGKRIAYMSAGQFGGTMSYEVPVAVTAAEKMGEALRALNDTELQNLQALGAQAERTGNEIANIDKQVARILNGRGGALGGNNATVKPSGRIKVGVTDNIDEKVRTQWDRENLRAIALSNTLKAPEETSSGSELWKIMTQGAEESTNQIESLTAAFEKLNEVEGVTLKSTVKESKKVEKSFDYAAEAVSSIGSALSQIEDPAAKVVGTIAQAVASVALGYSQATVAAAQTGNPYVWAAFAAAGLAQMLSMIATIHSATGYARGGEIKGNSYSGDNIPIMANAGEVVLTRAMANTLASSITDRESLSNLSWTIRMKGEDIYLTADRSQIRRGRGRILTSKG